MRKGEGGGRREGERNMMIGRDTEERDQRTERGAESTRDISRTTIITLIPLITEVTSHRDTIPAAPTHAHMNILPVTIVWTMTFG